MSMDEEAKRRLDDLNRAHMERVRDLVTDGRVEMVTEEADEVVVVCGLVEEGVPEPFDDNRHAPCALCGKMLMYRPYISDAAVKMCLPCMVEMNTATQN